MGSTQGEIRIGSSHQAKLPDNRLNLNSLDLSPDPEFGKEREEVRWVPSVTLDGDLVMYLRAARSMAAFAGMCDGGSAEDGCIAARRDETTINAMDVLHDCGYDPSKALQTLVKCPVPKSIEKKWTEEETKRFVKGLRQFGKNFYRIKKDLLPHKDTPELVEFYYLWKKTPGANNNRPHRRRRQGSLRRNRNTRNSRGGTPKEEVTGNASRPSPSSKDQGEASSGSDDDNDNSYDDSDSRENGGYRCQHCSTATSRDWLHAANGPKQGALLCSNCHSYYKQYGDLPPISRSETYLFQPVQADSPEGSPGRMRTRNKTKETPTKEKSKSKRSEVVTPEPEVDKKPFNNNISDSKSPGSTVTSPGDKNKRKIKSEPGVSRKRSNILQNEGEIKRKREHGPESGSGESDCESLLDEIDTNSPTQNVEEKCPKSETPTAPPLLPIAEVSRNDEDPVKVENEEAALPSSAIYPISTSPLVKDESVDPAPSNVPESSATNIPMPISKPFEYENTAVKTESGFHTSGERDESLPPVLTSEEGYVPKDEMPTLQANTNLADAASTTSPYPCGFNSQLDSSVDIKTEPGLQPSEENTLLELSQKPNHPESPAQLPVSPQPFSNQPNTSPSSALPYQQIAPESSRLADSSSEKPLPSVPVVLPGYGMYNENERAEKFIGQPSVPPNTLNLSQHQPNVPFTPFYHYPPHSSGLDKSENSAYSGVNTLQMEPQDLKIKQETPVDQQRSPPVDPLQSLKEVKVPGYSSTSISQPLLPTSASSTLSLTSVDPHPTASRSNSNSPFVTNVSVEDIKKESLSSELYSSSARVTTPLKSPSLNSSSKLMDSAAIAAHGVSHSPKLSQTPPYHPGNSALAMSQPVPTTRTPTSSPISTPSSAAPPTASQQPSPLNRASPAHLAHPHAYMPPIHPHQSYFQHPLFASAAAQMAHAMHHQYPHPPYAGYPYPFPYASPYPIPQPIPPPRQLENAKREPDGSTTLMTSHHSSSSSSSVTTRSLRDDESSQEITQTHHLSSSHHSSIHHHNDKQTISHSSSSSSSASVQHKVKRSSSPQHSSSTCHVSATLSQSTSSSVSTNHGQSTHHSHHHQHTHHHQSASAESPQLINMPLALGGSSSRNGTANPSLAAAQTKSHPSAILPGPSPVLSAHHPGLALPGLAGPSPANSLEALRAHAHALHSPLVQSASHGLGPGGYLGPADMSLASGELMKPEPGLLQPNEDGLMNNAEDDDMLSPTNHVPKGPSPDPKIEDSECHRSQSAIFLRHWNRGDYNSCARTDLTFKPVPNSKLDKKRQDTIIKKQVEKEREEREKTQSRKLTTPDKPETVKPPSRGPIETITSPYDRFARGTPYNDTPALRQLGEYARPHAGFSPVPLRTATSILPPQCIDPMLHYQLNMYTAPTRDRPDMDLFEREKRDQEMRALREKDLNERIKEEMMKSATTRLNTPIDPHWLDLRRFNPLSPAAPGALHPFGLYAAAGQPAAALNPLERERLERLGAYPRPTLIPGREAPMGLHHPSELLARPYADQLAHQAAAHEHMQRQILLERERFSHPAALMVQQHEEYLRLQQQQHLQREHETKIRALEEAARGGRP